MKKPLFMAFVLILIAPMIIITENVEAGSRSLSKLVGDHSKQIRDLRSSKKFAKKRVLLVVGGQRKATTIEGLLSAVDIALSQPQHSIFVEPLLMAETQEMGFADVDVNGPFISAIKLAKQPPADHIGVAALVIQYNGDATLPAQVLANIRTK